MPRFEREQSEYMEKLVFLNRVSKTVKGEPGALKMPPEYVKAACDEAHRLGYKVAAHVESPEGVRVALEKYRYPIGMEKQENHIVPRKNQTHHYLYRRSGDWQM